MYVIFKKENVGFSFHMQGVPQKNGSIGGTVVTI
jgi:hypothetical protein